jgi:hypothetical protein
MPRLKHRGPIAAVVTSRVISSRIPRLDGIQLYKTARPTLLERFNRIVISVSLSNLPGISDFIREANDRHYLHNLLVYDAESSNLLPQYMSRSNIRTYRNLIVHSDVDVPSRILNARSIGAEDHLIADARLVDDELVVIACSGTTYTLPISSITYLSGRTDREVRNFTVESDGSYITWPAADVDIDLQTIRELIDPSEKQKAAHANLIRDQRFGRAIARCRKAHNLRQSDIPGLSPRQVRRIETHGTSKPTTLTKLASAHALDLSTYLNTLAESLSHHQ